MTEHALITSNGCYYSLRGLGSEQKEFATISELVTYCRSIKSGSIQLDHLLYADLQRLDLPSQCKLNVHKRT